MSYTLKDEIRLHNQARELRAIAREYRTIIDEVRACSNALAEWDSPAADEWRRQCWLLLPECSAEAAELGRIADTIMNFTANNHYLLEEAVETLTGTTD